MPISKQEAARIKGLAKVERLQSKAIGLIESRKNANSVADELLSISQQTGDELVAQMAMLAHAGIASKQLAIAGTALASVNDQIATATNAFALAARIAQEGEAKLTFPFIAGKAASVLDLVKALEEAFRKTADSAGDIDGVEDLGSAFKAAKIAVANLQSKADKLAG